MGGPEGTFGKGIRAETVLIGDHHEFVIGFFGNAAQAGNGPGQKFQFFQGIDLLVAFGLHDDRAVAVYEEYFFHANRKCVVGVMATKVVNIPTNVVLNGDKILDSVCLPYDPT